MKLPPLVAKIWGNGKFLLFMVRSSTERPYLLRWLYSLRPNYLLTKPIPWTTFHAIDFLEKNLHPGHRVFEYGSGGSTLFFLRHGAICVSIEHDPSWYALLKQYILQSDRKRLDYRLVLPESGATSNVDPASPDSYVSGSPSHIGMTFRAYAEQIDSFPDGFFDVVLVDGRARPSCIAHSVHKVKVGGFLILDNSDRSYYIEKAKSFLQAFETISLDGVSATLPAVSGCTAYQRKY